MFPFFFQCEVRSLETASRQSSDTLKGDRGDAKLLCRNRLTSINAPTRAKRRPKVARPRSNISRDCFTACFQLRLVDIASLGSGRRCTVT